MHFRAEYKEQYDCRIKYMVRAKDFDLHCCFSHFVLYHPLSEIRDFSGTEPLLDLIPVCKFKFVCRGPVKKNQSALSFSV